VHIDIDSGFSAKSFRGRHGGTEHFINVRACDHLTLQEQIELVEERYADGLRTLGLAEDTAVFRRIYLSDAINQAAMVRQSGLLTETPDNPVAVSIVQQPPLPRAKIALLAYHIETDDRCVKQRLSPKHMLMEKNGQRHLWSTRLCAGGHDNAVSAEAQTRIVFGDLVQALSDQGANMAENCVRTWLYVKDVDVFYQGVVDARGELFLQHGMNEDTHYIASTGIEGACAHQLDVVSMDAYSNLGLKPGQMTYLNDFDRLCATKDYNVHFERGTRVGYADRAHHFISGTASIDKTGKVVHPGNVLAQLDRALENVDALLGAGTARLDDMMHLTVYLRDPSDYASVEGHLRRVLPDMPMQILQGPVCRPEWLIEVEGIAVVDNDQPEFPAF
jgi:enamine deaminase RidA (YjgF/YER057c/UK114 family)